jgi:16S rRNA (cytidine1402-2'-O)-methyltransferase
VRAALEAGFAVTPIPGPAAAIAALIASGLPSDSFTFLGFLPRRAADRRAALERIREAPRTLVLYEAPHRLAACLDDLLAVLGDRRAAVARELTKFHEEWQRGTLHELRQRAVAVHPRGEYTLVVAGAAPGAGAPAPTARPVEEVARQRLAALLAEGTSTRDAAATVARETGLARRDLYALALELGRS